MQQIAWIALAWAAGTAAILGSLMTLGTLLLWLVPSSRPQSKKGENQPSHQHPQWGHLKLVLVSAAIALVGLSLFVVVPFPQPY